MADNKNNHKRGAPGDKQGHNPINTRTPQEHIVLIGGPTNSFNAWWSFVNPRSEAQNPNGHGGFWAPQPRPRTLREIDFYLGVAPRAVDRSKSPDLAEYQRNGWSPAGIKELGSRGWTAGDVVSVGPETHDRYWGNFIDAAVRLYSQSSPLAAPLSRPAPTKDDIVTFMVYAPPYETRQRTDWAASPYNRSHLNKAGIKGNPLYDPSARRTSDSARLIENNPHLDRPPTLTEHDKRNQEKYRQDQEAARRNYKDQPLSDTDIDHYILMRTTSENQGRIIKRPPNNYCYFDYLEDALLNAVKVKGVMTKVLFVSHPVQVIEYIGSGQWIGERRKGMVSEYLAEEVARKEEARKKEIEQNAELLEEIYGVDTSTRYGLENYTFFPPPPVHTDSHGRPLKWESHWNRLWNTTPRVDRNRVKIVRFDYFGHSGESMLMLEWGWTNAKGELPGVTEDKTTHEITAITPSDLETVLKPSVASNAFATLWGCHLGREFGPQLADYFGAGVVAAETYTDFEKLIHNDTNMPVPVNGQQWFRYKAARKPAPVGAR